MSDTSQFDVWAGGSAYESYVGRWSRIVAREFLAWLDVPPNSRWLDVGCGTGALTRTVLDTKSPREVIGIDPSDGFVDYARSHINDRRARFEVGDAQSLAFEDATFNAVVSGLVLNFIPDQALAAAEMVRVASPGGTVAVYVWDYAGEMQMMRYFWDAVAALDPERNDLDEGRRFPICNPGPLADLFRTAGLRNVEVHAIDVNTRFRDFDDYWTPFLGGAGAAPGYVASLSEERRTALKERLRTNIPSAPDGSIDLVARVWAMRGRA
jgi:SAM-dependent methyltransferase